MNNLKQTKYLQPSILNFATEKKVNADEATFTPVDIVREPKVVLGKRRGRPPKYGDVKKKLKTQFEEEIIEIPGSHEEEEEEAKVAGEKTEEQKQYNRYQKTDFKTKKAIIEDFVLYSNDPPLIQGKPQPMREFCHDLGHKYKVNWSTVKSLCLDYRKNPNILVQLDILCGNSKTAAKTGHVVRRDPRLSYSTNTDRSLADWIYASIDLGYILTRESIREKGLELIKDENVDFKASDSWLDRFLERHHISLRKLNQQTPIQNEHLTEIASKFKRVVKDEIKRYNIKESMVINMDESPFFWEYLPRKVLAPKMSKTATGWKKGFSHARSTLILGVTADSQMLRPSLVLKRKTRYILQRENDIGLLLMNSNNGWLDEDIAIEWLTKVLLPYVKKEHCLLLWDSFEGHISEKVLKFLNGYKNIHVSIIVGGTTPIHLPLDISINKRFKSICRQYSVQHSNYTLRVLNQSNATGHTKSSMSQNIKKSELFKIYLNLNCLVNNQVVIAVKDHERQKNRSKQTVITSFTKTSVEDVYF